MKRYTLRSGTVVNLPSQGTDISRPPTEPYAYATESPTGNWVEFADYAALLEAAKLLVDLHKAYGPHHICPSPEQDRAQADEMVKSMRAVMNNPIARALIEGREPT